MDALVHEIQELKREVQKLQAQQAPTSLAEKEWYTVPEAAPFLGISTSTLYKKSGKGITPHKLPGGKNNFYHIYELKKLRRRVKTKDDLEAEAAMYLATRKKIK
jgi:predicted DNA-binding transcriptional regulator AlpA